MPSIIERIKHYLSGPQGRQAGEKARSMGRDPHTRQRLRHFMDQVRGGRQGRH